MKKLRIVIFVTIIILIIFFQTKSTLAYSNLPTINYNGKKHEISYSNVSSNDLFNNFKDVMPGDTRKQEILIKIKNIKVNTKIFLNIDENIDDEILEYIKIYSDNNELIKRGSLIEIGTFSRDEEIKLNVILKVPYQAGNEIENLKYIINWEIWVQEEDTNIIIPPVIGTTDETSNNFLLAGAIGILTLIGIKILILIFYYEKNNVQIYIKEGEKQVLIGKEKITKRNRILNLNKYYDKYHEDEYNIVLSKKISKRLDKKEVKLIVHDKKSSFVVDYKKEARTYKI